MGKKVLIDGQQRVTALTTALVGQPVINDSYNKVIIKIAFHPVEERFEMLNPAILKDKAWVHDIAEIIRPEFLTFQFIRNFQLFQVLARAGCSTIRADCHMASISLQTVLM
jgi:hypothetical protein